jgi:molybdopterin synthase sulfur carrier subunit
MNENIKSVRLSAGLRRVAGAKAVDVPTGPQTTARDLLRRLCEVKPALAERILTPDGELADGIMMIVGGRHIDFQQGLDTPIGAADEVIIIPPLSGG